MEEAAPDEHGRLIGEAHTSGRLRGADMLDASEAASSLFALQQVLQRDDAPATTKALRALTNGIRARDANAKQTCAEWARSSPRLAELFHAYSAPGGRDADAKLRPAFVPWRRCCPSSQSRTPSLAGRWLPKRGASCERCVLPDIKIRDEPPWKHWRRAPSAVLGRSKSCGGSAKMRRRGSHYAVPEARKGREVSARAS